MRRFYRRAARPPGLIAPPPGYAVAMQADSIERTVERVLRGLYSVALYVLVPITVYHLIWRGFRQRESFLRWTERSAIYPDTPHAATAWVLAFSLGAGDTTPPPGDDLRQPRPAPQCRT